jgi:hypothetical protein
MGTEKNGVCDTDPKNGAVKKVDCCSGSCKDFPLSKVISKKTCSDCSLPDIKAALSVPEVGELVPGKTKMVGGEPIRVATIDGG